MAAAAIALVVAGSLAQSLLDRPSLPTIELSMPAGVITVELADTAATRARGLSGRKRLELDGLLLEWPAPGRHPVWMADMRFSLDLVWLDTSGTVLAVASHVPPCDKSPCPLYEPAGTERSAAVLELQAGRAGQYGLGVAVRVAAISP